MSAETAFASAILATLKADPGVRAALGDPARVFAKAPRGAAFPYLSLGRGDSEPLDGAGVDLIDHRLSLHVWARREDQAALKDAVGAVRAALHQADLSLAAPFACVLCRVVYADLFTGPDGATLHGVVRARGIIEKGNTP
ncbi:MAG: DUF3168 domain-containing protein [Oceanicaulis sp.]